MHEAEEYTISIRKECLDGEILYVARVAELPDVEEYADTFCMARELALDTIQTTQTVFLKNKIPFPPPVTFTPKDFSGRVTLRLPKSLHHQATLAAEEDGVSLNTYITTCVASYHNVQSFNYAQRFTDIYHSIHSPFSIKRSENLRSFYNSSASFELNPECYDNFANMDLLPNEQPTNSWGGVACFSLKH